MGSEWNADTSKGVKTFQKNKCCIKKSLLIDDQDSSRPNTAFHSVHKLAPSALELLLLHSQQQELQLTFRAELEL